MAVVTPYIDDINERERRFLETGGFEVESISGHGIERNTQIGALTPEEAYRQAADAIEEPGTDADAVFISCTNYRTFEAIERIEADTGVPVVTSNQATLWDAMTNLEIDRSGMPLGRLFET